MSYSTYNPFRELDVLRREVNRLFDAPEVGRWTRPFSRVSFLPGISARAYPLIRVADDGDNLQVEALAPGLDPDTLKITVVRNQLTIEGEKAGLPEEKSKGTAFHRAERAEGKFARTLTLPVEIDTEKVAAKYEHGLLKITLPRSEASRPKQIKVNLN